MTRKTDLHGTLDTEHITLFDLLAFFDANLDDDTGHRSANRTWIGCGLLPANGLDRSRTILDSDRTRLKAKVVCQ